MPKTESWRWAVPEIRAKINSAKVDDAKPTEVLSQGVRDLTQRAKAHHAEPHMSNCPQRDGA